MHCCVFGSDHHRVERHSCFTVAIYPLGLGLSGSLRDLRPRLLMDTGKKGSLLVSVAISSH